MLLRKAHRHRIYPDDAQEELFRRTIGCCRLIYNLCLEQKNEHLRRRKSLSAYDQMKELVALKEAFPFFGEVPHHPLQQSIHDLHTAFKNYFEGLSKQRELANRGIKVDLESFPKWPTFHRRGGKGSFRYPDPKQVKFKPSEAGGAASEEQLSLFPKTDDQVFLPKAGWVRIVLHRPVVGRIKNVTVSTMAGDWFVSVQTEQEVAIPANTGSAVGVDIGSVQPIVLSDGKVFGMPRTSPAERRRLENAHRFIARRTKGSRNREKAKRRLARLQAKHARRRRDAAHKATTAIAKNHGVVVVENLRVKEMTKTGRGSVDAPGEMVQKRANRNRALLEVMPRTIRTMLEYKCEWYGSTLVVVEPEHTSSCCSECGAFDVESRVTRDSFVCTDCHKIMDADVNAARNILAFGTSPTGGHPGLACGSSQNTGRKQEDDTREGRSSALQGRE